MLCRIAREIGFAAGIVGNSIGKKSEGVMIL